jgi:3-hydroxy acid dehydrogenase/malonic semialdehyde reductase
MNTAPIALITGASSGIGEATALTLANHGFNTILVGRRKDRLEALKASIEQNFPVQAYVATVDVRDKQAVQDMVNALPLAWRSVQVLINNAGLAWGLSAIDQGQLEHWDTMIDTNIKGLLYVTKFVTPLLVENGNGHIVNIGSIAGKEVYANGNVYCATKHAVDALSRSMRLDLSHYPIKVSAIHPGAVETEFSLVRFDGDAERAANVYKGFENLVAQDIADAIWFMLSRPKHVNINEMTIRPTAQPMAGVIHRQ